MVEISSSTSCYAIWIILSLATDYNKDSNPTRNRIIAPEEPEKLDVCELKIYLLMTPMSHYPSVHTFPISGRITRRHYDVAPVEPWSNSEIMPCRNCLSEARFVPAPSKAYQTSFQHPIDPNKRSLASQLQQCLSTPLSFRKSAKNSVYSRHGIAIQKYVKDSTKTCILLTQINRDK